jgi:hypothetical protein
MEEERMTQVDCEEIRRLKARLREINALPFEEIEWMEGDKPAKFNPQAQLNWAFIGLNNADVVHHVIDGADGIVYMTLTKKT